MGYVEYLRAQHAFVRFAVVLTIGVAFTLFSVVWGINHAHHGYHHFAHGGTQATVSIGGDTSQADSADSSKDTDDDKDRSDFDLSKLATYHFTIPMGLLFGIAGYLAIGFATILGSSLHKENGRGGFAFTKPIARERLALTYLAIDAVAVVAMFVYTVLLGFASYAVLGVLGHVVFEPGCWMIAGIGLGAAAMWYAILQAATSMRVSGGGLIVGMSFVVFLLGLAFWQIDYFGPVFHGLIMAIDFFNPLAYFGLHSFNDNVSAVSMFGFSEPVSLAITWGLAIVAFAGAVYGWKRVEV